MKDVIKRMIKFAQVLDEQAMHKSTTDRDSAYLKGYVHGLKRAIVEFSAVEREAVATQVNPEEDFYCTEHADFGDPKCKTQCPYCERV